MNSTTNDFKNFAGKLDFEFNAGGPCEHFNIIPHMGVNLKNEGKPTHIVGTNYGIKLKVGSMLNAEYSCQNGNNGSFDSNLNKDSRLTDGGHNAAVRLVQTNNGGTWTEFGRAGR